MYCNAYVVLGTNLSNDSVNITTDKSLCLLKVVDLFEQCDNSRMIKVDTE